MRIKNLPRFNSGIYEIRNTVNNKIYIGRSKDLKSRRLHHLSSLRCHNHRNVKLRRASIKYGFDAFKFNILFFCDKENLIFYEQLCLDKFKPEYNISPTADSNYNCTLSPGSGANISASKMGKKRPPFSDEWLANLSKAKIGNKNCVGHVAPIEVRNKMSISQKERYKKNPVTKETREILRQRALGNKHYEGKKHTDQWRKNRSEEMMAVWEQRRADGGDFFLGCIDRPGYGVYKRGKRFVARTTISGKSKSFDTEEEAHAAVVAAKLSKRKDGNG